MCSEMDSAVRVWELQSVREACLGSEAYFSDTGWAAEESDVSAPFAGDDVVEARSMHGLRFSKREDELLLIGWKDERIECVVVESDIFDQIEVEEEPLLLFQGVTTHMRETS